ncbi:MAG TPA: fumarylacetoacetate hydrolase family protein [Terriglobales bacterium]|nr:fumarylacetoacetate hydrolase family protein [Terriglobales bacterium]
MKLATFMADGPARLGVVLNDKIIDLAELASLGGLDGSRFTSMIEVLRTGEALDRARSLSQNTSLLGKIRGVRLDSVRLLSPVPNPGKIIAVGLNYLDHCVEQGIDPPAAPLLFAKFPNSVTGPYDPIIIPEEDPEVDYEVELGVVIGRRAKRVSEADALRYVAGYLVLNDVSARKWQFADKQWTRGKSCDTFAPMGPWLTTADEVPQPENLAVFTRVNGQTLQDSSTKNLIFGVSRLISYISASITLEPGDVIATGTPPGVGVFRKPPIYLKPGDVVETGIEKLGVLKNPVIAEQRQAAITA